MSSTEEQPSDAVAAEAAATETPAQVNDSSSEPMSVSFAAEAKDGNEQQEDSTTEEQAVKAQQMQEQRRRRSSRGSFFGRMGEIFRRAGGEDGADLETLKGTTGLDFESNAIIYRNGEEPMGFFSFFSFLGGGSGALRKNKKNSTREQRIVIKGPFCFVYEDEDDPSPTYALSLAQLTPVQTSKHIAVSGEMAKGNKNKSGRYVMVKLESSLGDAEYTVGLPNQEIASDFIATVEVQAAAGEAEEIRKELGHEHLMYKRSSVKFAQQVATRKTKKQPKKASNQPASLSPTGIGMLNSGVAMADVM